MNKKMREIKAQMDALNEEAKSLFEAKDYEGAEKIVDEIESLEKAYKTAERLFQGEKAEVTDEVVNKAKSVNKVKAFADSIKKIRNTMSVGTDTDGGYTVPDDVVTDIEHLKEAKKSLKNLVSVENVSTMNGSRTYKKRSSLTGFNTIGEKNAIGQKETPKYDRYSYDIKKRAGIYPATNELFEDSDANIYNELITWIADDSRVTDNKSILAVINTKAQTELTGLDDIKKTLNITLGQAFKPTSKIVTNDDGLQYLDTLKDEKGNYLLQSSPADPMKLVLCAGATTIPVEVFPNSDIPTTENKIPFIIGDLKEGIKFFDRKKLNIMTSNVALVGSGDDAINAFEDDMTLFRAIQRDDVVTRDAEAFVNGYITVTATV